MRRFMVFILSMVWVAFTFGQSNDATIKMTGNYTKSKIDQSGATNSRAYIEQVEGWAGADMTSTVTQRYDNNEAKVYIGAGSSTQFQTGNDNTALLGTPSEFLWGSSSTFTQDQGGVGNTAVVTGPGGVSTLVTQIQYGELNESFVFDIGDNNIVTNCQYGDENSATLSFDPGFDTGHIISIYQAGNDNTAAITFKDVNCNYDLKQLGNSNTVRMDYAGTGYSIISQEGNRNKIKGIDADPVAVFNGINIEGIVQSGDDLTIEMSVTDKTYSIMLLTQTAVNSFIKIEEP